nr:MAG TPA: hypothetical protein [Caudoviricetes sp.]
MPFISVPSGNISTNFFSPPGLLVSTICSPALIFSSCMRWCLCVFG